jgi:hypothetical protein
MECRAGKKSSLNGQTKRVQGLLILTVQLRLAFGDFGGLLPARLSALAESLCDSLIAPSLHIRVFPCH